MPSSAGWGGALTQDLDDGDDGMFPKTGNSSSHETLDGSLQASTGGSVKKRGSWARPAGINVDHLGPEYFLLEDSHDGQTRSEGTESGVVEEKEVFACHISSPDMVRQLEDTTRSDRIRCVVSEEKGGITCPMMSAQTEHGPRPCCAVSASPPIPAPFCDLSPCRVAPSLSPSRLPTSMQDTSAAAQGDSPTRSKSQSDLRCRARDMAGEGHRRGQSPSFAMGEVMAEQEKRGCATHARSLDCAVEMTALAALSPGVASPPTLRSGKRVRSTSGKQGVPPN